jgi:hypothetical protein
MVSSIECFNEVNKKDTGVKVVFLSELEGKSKAEECINGTTLWLGAKLFFNATLLQEYF